MTLKLIPGTPAPDTPAERVRQRLRAARPPSMFACYRCSGSEVLQTRIGMMLKNGRPQGGTKVWICAACHRKGERVVLA